MATTANVDDIDMETLQAQIDMSMAFTQNLVSSWMKSTQGKLPSSKSHHDEEKELEEYMRRPPRLGVGATVPESTSMLGRDTARLKSRLTASSGKKRARQDDKDVLVVPSDDEEESRASVIKKKPRIDVFGKQTKGKKSHPKGMDASKPSSSQTATPNPKSGPSGEMAVASTSPETGEKGKQHEEPTGSLVSSSPRKRKKRKHRHAADHHTIDLTDSPAPPAPLHSRGPVDSIQGNDTSPRTSKKTSPPPSATSAISSPEHAVAHASNVPPPQTPPISSATVPNPFPKLHRPSAISILNLCGPPATKEGDGVSTASPKKRRRRKKKKKKVLAEAAGEEDDSDD